MHFVLMTRGVQHEVDLWKKFMETQMWWWTRQPLLKDKDGKYIPDGEDEDGTPKYKRGPEQTIKVAGALRPIQLWEYVIPREGVVAVNGKLMKSDNLKELLLAMNIHAAGGQLRPEMKPIAWMVRKAMKLKQIPEFPEIKDTKPEELVNRWIKHDAVATYPIGMREDKKQDFIFNKGKPNEEAYYQEGL